MGAFVGLLAGLGVLLVWHGLSAPTRARSARMTGAKTRELLVQAGLPGVSPAHLVAAQFALGLVAGAITFVVTQSISVSLVFVTFAAAVPRLLVKRLRRKRQADLRELWPEVVDNLTSGVRAGLSLPEALAGIGARGPEPLREPFRQFGSDYRTTGRFNGCLDRLKDALADPVGDRVVESLRVAREVGGTDLGRLLSTLSAFLRDDARTRAELVARQSWSVNAARMAVAAPWLVLLLLATQRETLRAYDSPTGTVILVSGAVLSFVAYRLMIHIGRLPEDRRVLR
jgi:tight adherence protein B